MKKVALITGASSGIGKELAKIHAKGGGDLILVARREEALIILKAELEALYNIKVEVIVKDLIQTGAAKELYDTVMQKNIEVEYLINNAGFGLRGQFDELPLQRQSEMMSLNMVALTQLTYYFLNDMKKRDSGKILNTSSTASFVPGPLQAVYFASKAYVTSFSNALYEELRQSNITVTNLMPGATQTEFGKTSGMDKTKAFEKVVTAQSVAQDGYSAMLNGSLDVISGLTFSQNLLRLMVPFTPKKMLLKEIRRIQEVS